MTEPPRVARIDDLPVLHGEPARRPVRQELGIRAFGINAFTADAGALVIEEHDEVSGAAGRHEEAYVVVRGHARFTVDGEDIDAPAGTVVFVPDPASRRVAHAADDATVVLVLGGTPGKAFEPSAWEQSSYAAFLAGRGEHERALTMAREVVEAHPGSGNALYNAACAEALAGDRDAAIAHLTRALELEPELARHVGGDSDFDPIRDDPRFPAGA